MKRSLKAALAAILVAPLFIGQISTGQAPAGATGQCKDGTYTTSASKSGACHGHKGVDKWFAEQGASAPKATKSTAAEPAQKPAPAAAPAPAPAPAPAAAPAPTTHSTKQESAPRSAPAPGGGPGMVWVNTSSNVYHCPGTRYYGTTKEGKYMSEADAVKMGARADSGKACK